MSTIIQTHHLLTTIFVFVAYIIIREIAIYYDRKKRQHPKKIVGTISNDEVYTELLKEKADLIYKRQQLTEIDTTKFNNINEVLKADREYNSRIDEINEQLNNLEY